MAAEVKGLYAAVSDRDVAAAIAAGWGRTIGTPVLAGCVRRALGRDRAALAHRVRAELGDGRRWHDDVVERVARIIEGQET